MMSFDGKTDRDYTKFGQLLARHADTEGLRVLAFPCNQFKAQEPWADSEIKEFVRGRYQVEQMDLFSKVCVNGEDAHSLFKWLKRRQPGPNGE
nr:hypothetical protein BaRGS_030200 [Batillaria attramentaria]